MISRKKATKLIIILILFVFIVITGLAAVVPYLGGNKNAPGTGDVLSGDVIESGIDVSTGSETIDTGTAQLPEITKEEAAKKIQQVLSGN